MRLSSLWNQALIQPPAKGRHKHKIVWTADTIRRVESAVEADGPLNVIELAEETDINHISVFRILKDDLGLVKKSATWIPCLLSSNQKKKREDISKEFVQCARAAPEKFLASIVTMDKSAVSFHTLETKEQSKQWLP